MHFARHLRHLEWQPTDRADYLPDLAARIAEEGTPNLLAPLELDVLQEHWPPVTADAVYSANTLHIMSWPEVEAFFSGVGQALAAGGVLVVYGPFRYAGQVHEREQRGLRPFAAGARSGERHPRHRGRESAG